MRNIQAYFDGSCEPINPGGTARWGIAILEGEELLFGCGGYIGEGEGMTNNVAEYRGAIACLTYLHQHHKEDFIEMFGDSLMVVNMINGVWGKRNPHRKMPHLIPLVSEARKLFEHLESCSLEWVPREQNLLADYYSKKVD